MSVKYFVAGTDTNIGKTYISAGLLKAFNRLGKTTIGVKPIASGGFWSENQLRCHDGLALHHAASIQLDYQHINPIVFEPPIAPHIAALQQGVSLTVDEVIAKTKIAMNHLCDIHIVEGVGGWLVPLNDKETMADFAASYQMEVILVVGMRLGCLNHAILTYNAMQHAGVSIAGWAANCFEPESSDVLDVVNTLKQWLNVPYLGLVGYGEQAEDQLMVGTLLHDTSIPR